MKKNFQKKDVRAWNGILFHFRFQLYITVNRHINLNPAYEIFLLREENLIDSTPKTFIV
jgi:hypothetical protein